MLVLDKWMNVYWHRLLTFYLFHISDCRTINLTEFYVASLRCFWSSLKTYYFGLENTDGTPTLMVLPNGLLAVVIFRTLIITVIKKYCVRYISLTSVDVYIYIIIFSSEISINYKSIILDMDVCNYCGHPISFINAI